MAGGALAGMMVAKNLDNLMKGLERAEKAWAELGDPGLTFAMEEVTGTLEKASGAKRPVLRGTRHGVSVEVRVASDFVHYAWTTLSTNTTAAGEAKLGVHPSPGGALGYLRSLIGQDIEIGDEAFDAGYLITGKPESFAKTALVPSVRDLVLALGPGMASLKVAEDGVEVVLHGVETDAARLGAALDLVAACAKVAP